MINSLEKTLSNLQSETMGMFQAAKGPHYQKYWMRDNMYIALAFLESDPKKYADIFHSLLDYYIKSERDHNKYYWMQHEPNNKAGYKRFHPRCDDNLEEYPEEWGFKQNDNIGEILFGIYLGESKGIKILRGPEDYIIVYKLIKVLEIIEYWQDPDHGIWEEGPEEVRASSVGACIAGLEAIRKLGFEVKQELIDKGKKTLLELHPFETKTRRYDLALLTLIWPFNILTDEQALQTALDIENNLVRPRGVIRYLGDRYYASDKGSMEWTFGIAYLALIWAKLGNMVKALYYKEILINKCILEGYKVPEGYYAYTDIPNDNTDLGWSIAMTILVLRNIIDERGDYDEKMV